jgi:hypothetical protein
MRMPGREPMPYRLLGDLVFRHGCDDFVVNEQAVYVQRLEARRIGRLEFDRASPFRILDAREECRLEQFRFVFEFLHSATLQQPVRPTSPSLPYNHALA